MKRRSDEEWIHFLERGSDEEKKLHMDVYEYADMFGDMLLENEAQDSDLEQFITEDMKYLDYHWFIYSVETLDDLDGYYNHSQQKLAISDNLKGEEYTITVLHEMIHLHEFVLNEQRLYFHDIVYWKLYYGLKEKIKNIDELLNYYTDLIELNFVYEQGGLHDVLFFLKSLDLDLRMGYELGTVCGYGQQEFIQKLKSV